LSGLDVQQSKKNAPEYGYLAKRQVFERQSSLSDMEKPEFFLPFPSFSDQANGEDKIKN
jgi:hypothetical protein